MPLVDEHGDIPNNTPSQVPVSTDSVRYKSRTLKITLWVISFVVGLPIVIYAGYWAFAIGSLIFISESTQKIADEQQATVSAEVARFTIPSGCTQKARNDQPGGLDARYEYRATYDCPGGKWENIHIVLAADLRKLGYKAVKDASALTGAASGPADQLDDTVAGMNNSLTYTSACCDVDFIPVVQADNAGIANQDSSGSLSGYSIGVSKHYAVEPDK
jgi:hypothetical protein